MCGAQRHCGKRHSLSKQHEKPFAESAQELREHVAEMRPHIQMLAYLLVTEAPALLGLLKAPHMLSHLQRMLARHSTTVVNLGLLALGLALVALSAASGATE
jgi:hypothetical protein